jgi:hypothetical protein
MAILLTLFALLVSCGDAASLMSSMYNIGAEESNGLARGVRDIPFDILAETCSSKFTSVIAGMHSITPMCTGIQP